jgi:hypothetical protein
VIAAKLPHDVPYMRPVFVKEPLFDGQGGDSAFFLKLLLLSRPCLLHPISEVLETDRRHGPILKDPWIAEPGAVRAPTAAGAHLSPDGCRAAA